MKLQDNFGPVATPEGVALSCDVNALGRPTPENGVIDSKGVFPGLSNPNSPAITLAARLLAATNLCHAIAACEPEDAAFILAGVLAELSSGPPPPPLMGVMDEARSWADFASPIELKAYAVACFLRMPAKVQAEFLTWASPHVSGGAR